MMDELRTILTKAITGECPDGEHDWRPTSPVYSDGWTRECKTCGKEDSVTR